MGGDDTIQVRGSVAVGIQIFFKKGTDSPRLTATIEAVISVAKGDGVNVSFVPFYPFSCHGC